MRQMARAMNSGCASSGRSWAAGAGTRAARRRADEFYFDAAVVEEEAKKTKKEHDSIE